MPSATSPADVSQPPESKPLEALAQEFNGDLTRAVCAFTGEKHEFAYSWLGGISVSIRLAETCGESGIVKLKSNGQAVLGIKPVYRCTWDSTSSFLAVSSSSFAVYPYAKVNREPLFRVEYERKNTTAPSSHFHVHAHWDEFTHLLGSTSRLDASKNSNIKRYFKSVPAIADFH